MRYRIPCIPEATCGTPPPLPPPKTKKERKKTATGTAGEKTPLMNTISEGVADFARALSWLQLHVLDVAQDNHTALLIVLQKKQKKTHTHMQNANTWRRTRVHAPAMFQHYDTHGTMNDSYHAAVGTSL